ncbi:MAG: hypothetical protein KGH66_03670 [Candidatus Micrarchaeota archaeon]|nr:hypothetical protein [Candidatus Micrarchaeota archaeon]
MVTQQLTAIKSFGYKDGTATRTIHISNGEADEAGIDSVVPQGHRPIADERRINLAYLQNEEFREYLFKNYGVRTAIKGVKKSGYEKINTDGSTSKVTESEWRTLPENERKYSWPGDRLAVVYGDYYYGDVRLGVDGVSRAGDRRRVAYEKDDGKIETKQVADSRAATPEVAKVLRVDRGQTVVITSPSGDKIKMEVANGATVHVE